VKDVEDGDDDDYDEDGEEYDYGEGGQIHLVPIYI
jgi:hypothetical protein